MKTLLAYGFKKSSTPGKVTASRTQIIGYIAGGATVLLGAVELFGLLDLPFIDDPFQTIQIGLGMMGLGFLRRAVS